MSAQGRERSREFETALAQALSRKLRPSGKYCPSPETIATYFEGSLTPEEAERCELHFSTCAGCQHEIGALVRMEISGTRPEDDLLGEPLWTRARIAALAGTMLIAGLGTLIAIRVLPAGNFLSGTSPTPNLLVEPAIDISPASNPTALPTEGRQSEAETPPEPSLALLSDRGAASEPPATASTPILHEKPQFAEWPLPAITSSQVGGELSPSRATVSPPEEPSPVPSSTATVKAISRKPLPRPTPPRGLTPPPQPLAVARAPSRNRDLVFPPTPQPTPSPRSPTATVSVYSATPSPSSTPRQVKVLPPTPLPSPKPSAQPSGALAAFGRLLSGQIFSPQSARRTVIILAPGKSGVAWRIGPGGRIERSGDFGRTWKMLASGVNVDLLAGAAPAESVCWLVGRSGVILRTTDGEHWERIRSPTTRDLLRIFAKTTMAVSVEAEGGETFVTSDGGRSWKPK